MFVACAEAKGMLPAGVSNQFSLQDIAGEISATRRGGDPAVGGYWGRITRMWHAVDNAEGPWAQPAYNSWLFSSDHDRNPAGAALARIHIPDDEIEPVLASLLLDDDQPGGGFTDFENLPVREFGSIYERLL